MKMRSLPVAFFVLSWGLAIAQEQPPARPDDRPRAYRYNVPERLEDGWETGPIGDAGLDAGPLAEMFGRILNPGYKNIHGVLIVKDGRLVVEEYFRGKNAGGQEQDYDRDTLHSVQSVTKSVNALLIGIAIDRGLIAGVDEPLSTFFPEHAALFQDDGKKAIRLKDCLAMSSGLAWNESGIPYTDPRNDAYRLNRSEDPIRYVLEKPIAEKPGSQFAYNSGLSILLGEVVRKAAGQAADAFADEHLFRPLGITQYRWAKLPNGSVQTGGGLGMRPRDMARIGQLMLDGGRWKGKQVVGEGWVRESIRQQAPYRGYGYQWWLRSFRGKDRALDAFAAQGLGGQFIVVIPDPRIVAVFTGWNDGALTEQPFEMLQRFIVPAVGGP